MSCPVLRYAAFALPMRAPSYKPSTQCPLLASYTSMSRPLLFCSCITRLVLFCTEIFVVLSISIPFRLSKDSKHNKYLLFGMFFEYSASNADITLLPPSDPLTHQPASKQANLLDVWPFLDAKMILQDGTGCVRLLVVVIMPRMGNGWLLFVLRESQWRSLCV